MVLNTNPEIPFIVDKITFKNFLWLTNDSYLEFVRTETTSLSIKDSGRVLDKTV